MPLAANESSSVAQPLQYLAVNDGGALLSPEAQTLWQQGLSAATSQLAALLTLASRDSLLAEVFGRAGTDAALFEANREALLAAIGGDGLQIAVELRSDAELGGAMAAYAPVGHTGSERIYVNADKITSGALDLQLLTSALLEEFGHAMDRRLNGGADSPGDEGQLFAAQLTGVELTADQRALIDAEDDTAVLVIDGVQVGVECDTFVSMTSVAFSTDSGVSGTDKITNTASQTLSFVYNYNQNNSTAITFYVDNGNLSGTRVNVGSPTVVTGTNTNATGSFTATTAITLRDGTNTLAVYTAASGGTAVWTGSYTLDTTAPSSLSTRTLDLAAASDSGTSSTDNNTNDTTPDITVSTLNGVTMSVGDVIQIIDTSNSNAVVGSYTVVSSDLTTGAWNGTTKTITLSSALADGLHNLAVRLADLAGNTGTQSTATLGVTIDATAPTVSSVVATGTGITSGAGNLKAGAVVTLTVNTSEAVTIAGGTPSLTLNSGGTATYSSGTGTNALVFSYTVGATDNAADLQVSSLNTNGATLTDTAGNSLATFSFNPTGTLVIDTLAPTLAITSSASALKVGETATITFTFSEAPTGFAAADITTTGGTLGALSGTGLTRTATFTPTASTNSGTASITVASGSYTDAAGNSGGEGTTPSISFDTLAPTFSSTYVSGYTSNGLNTAVLLEFSENISARATGNIQLQFSTAAGTSGTTAALTPGTWAIAAGTSGGTPSSTVNAWYDFEQFIYLVRGANYTTNIWYNLDIPTNLFADAAGNNLAAINSDTSSNIFFNTSGITGTDTTAPTASATAVTIANGANATVQSTEAGLAFLVKNTINISGAANTDAKLDLIAASADNQWNVVRIATASTNTSLSAAGLIDGVYNIYALDLSGNLSAAATNSVTIDGTAPTISSVVITGADANLAVGQKITVTVNTSENATVVTTGGTPYYSIDVGGVSKQASYVSGTGSSALVFEYTIAAGDTDSSGGITAAANALTLNSGTLKDAAGNNLNLAFSAITAGTNSIAVDGTAPTVTISDNNSGTAKIGETVTFTFTFSEAVTGFSAAGITVGNGTKGTFTAVSSSVYTLVVTPTASSSGNVTIDVAASAATDAAGNANTAPAQYLQPFDTAAPAAPTFALTSDTGSSSSDGVTNVGTVTVSGVETNATWEYSINSGTAWTTGSGTSFTLAAGTYAIGAIKVRQTDLAGNVTVTPSQNAAAIIVDATAPAALTFSLTSDTGSSNSDGITNVGTVTVSGIETNATWEYSINSGTAWTTGSGSSFTLAAGTYAIGAIKVRQTDLAGNVTATPSQNAAAITVDATAPAAPSFSLATDSGSSSSDGVTNVGTVNVTGLEANSTWEYSTNSGTAWTTGSGSTFTLAAGTYAIGAIKVRQTDLAGNTTATPSQNSAAITVDGTPPAAPSITSVSDNVAPITGSLTTGGTTNDTNLTVRVAFPTAGSLAVAGNTIQLCNSTAALGSAHTITSTDITNGYADVATGSLSDGTIYTINAKLIDVAGNASSASGNFITTIDSTAPAAPSITFVSDNVGPNTGTLTSGGTTNDTNLTVRVGFPTTGSLAVAGNIVQLYNSTAALGSAYTLTSTDITNGYAEIATGSLSNGNTYTINAKLIDAAGNASSASGNFTTTVDTTVTTGTLSLANYTDSGTSATDFISTDNTFNLALSGNEAGSTAVYQVSTNGGSSWSTTTSAQSGLTDGAYQFRTAVTRLPVPMPSSAALKVSVGGEVFYQGLTAQITVINTGSTTLGSWNLTFDTTHLFTGTPWGISVSQVNLGGGLYRTTLTGFDWAASLTAGQSVTVGSNATQGLALGQSGQFTGPALFATTAAELAAYQGTNPTYQGDPAGISASSNMISLTVDRSAPTSSVGSQSAQVVEAGGSANGSAGTAAATITVTKADALSTASFDTTYLSANGWSSADAGVTYTKSATYGTATFTLSSGVVAYALNNSSAATQALTANQAVSDGFGSLQIVDPAGNTSLSSAISFAITGSNDAPTITSGTTASFAENATGTVYTATATDPDASATLTYSIAGTDAALFSINSTTGAVTFNSAPNFEAPTDAGANNVYDFTVSAFDGSLSSAAQGVAITVTNVVESAPVLTSVTINLTEGDTKTLAASNFVVSDLEGTTNFTFTVSSVAAGIFQLASNPGQAITSFTTSQLNAGVVQFAQNGGEAPPSYYATASNGSSSSNILPVVAVMLNVNDAPVVVAASLTVAEGQTVAVGTANFNVSDSDSNSFTYTVSSVSNGRFQLSSNPGQAISSFSTAQLSAGLVQFVHDGGEVAPAYSVQVSDGSLSSNIAAAAISFTNVNDAAVVTAGNSIGYTENGSPAVIAGSISVSDVDSANLSGATVAISTGFSAGDLLSFANQNGITGAYNAASGVLTLSGTATVAQYQAALRSVGYSSSSDNPTASSASRSISWVVNDGAAVNNLSAPATSTITLASVNDAPGAASSTITIAEDTAYTFTATNFGFTDVDGNSLSNVIITALPVAGSLRLNGAAVTANQVIAAASIGLLVFSPAANGNGASYASIGFRLQDNGGTANGGSDTSAAASFTFNVSPVNDAPVITSNGGGASAALSVAENTTVVTTVTASDIDSTGLVYSISGGADQAKFSINASSGLLSFVAAPDYENPTDAGGDNTYDVIVNVGDGSLSASQAIAVAVTNVNDAAPVLAPVSLSISEGQTVILSGANISATDADSTNLTYTTSNVSGGSFSLAAAPTTAITSFSSADLAAGLVRFSQNGGESAPTFSITASDGVNSSTGAALVSFTNLNDAPELAFSSSTAAAYTERGTAVAPFSGSAQISDPDSASLVGASVSFSAGYTSGDQLIFSSQAGISGSWDEASRTLSLSGNASQAAYRAALESIRFGSTSHNPTATSASRTLFWHLDDGSATNNLSTAITSSITITAVDEAPVILSNGAGTSASITIPELTTYVTTVVATDLDSSNVSYSIDPASADAARFSIDSSTGILSFLSAPSFHSPADAGANNVYDVTVRASDGSLFDSQALAIAISDTPAVVLSSSRLALNSGSTATINLSFNALPDLLPGVSVTVGSLSAFTVMSGSNGLAYCASYTPPAGVADATASFTIAAWTTAGGARPGRVDGSAVLAIDTEAPVLQINTPISGGFLNGVEVLSSLTIGGTSSGLANGRVVTVALTDGITTFSKTATVQNNSWSNPFSAAELQALAEGTISVSANASDAAGNAATQAVASFLKDTLAPTLAINTPISGGFLNASEVGSSLTLSGTTNANGRTVSVTLGSGGSATTYTATAAAGAWSVVVPSSALQALLQGSVSVRADVSDIAGNAATQATASFIKDTLAPTLTITTPISAGYLNAAEQLVPLVLSGTSTGLADGATVTVGLAGVAYSATVANNAWSTSVPAADLQALSQGSLSVSANASDLAGNAASASASFTKDTINPTVTINGPISSDGYLSASEVNSSLTISGSSSGIDSGRSITLAVGSSSYTATVQASGSWSKTLSSNQLQSLSDGTISITANGTDAAGNAAPEASTTVVKDTNTPTISVNQPISAGYLNLSELAVPLALGGSVTDANGQTVTVTLLAGSTTLATFTTTASASAWSVTVPTATLSALPQGTITVNAAVSNAAGTAASPATASFIKDTVAPTLTITAPIGGDGYVNKNETAAALSISGTTSGASNGRPVAVVVGGVSYATTVINNAWSVSVSSTALKALSDGTIAVAASVSDEAGNAVSQASSFILDTVAPTTAPTVNATTTDPSTLAVLSGTATVPSGGGLTVTVNGASYTSVAVSGGTWTLNLASATPSSGKLGSFLDGTNYTVTATATDPAGNGTSGSGTLGVSTPTPNTPTVNALTTLLDGNGKPSSPISGGVQLRSGEKLTVSVTNGTATAIYDNVMPTGSGSTWSINLGSATPTSGSLPTFVLGNSYNIIAKVTSANGSLTATDISSGELTIGTLTNLGTLSAAVTTNGAEDNGADGTISGTPTVFTFTRTPASGVLAANLPGLIASYSLGGTSVLGSDYAAPAGYNPTTNQGTVSFAAGALTTTLTLNTINNSIVNGVRSLNAYLIKPSDYTLAVNYSAGALLVDNDVAAAVVSLPVVSINSTSLVEGIAGTSSTAKLQVTLSQAYSQDVSVQWTTTSSPGGSLPNATATAGSDYVATSGTVMIAANSTAANVNITINGDNSLEANENFYVQLTGVTNATLSPTGSTGTVTIVNNDASGKLIDNSTSTTAVTLTGTDYNDTLIGGSASDLITGGIGNDRLKGGMGGDQLNGGTGSDTFEYASLSESTRGTTNQDYIVNFDLGSDRIKLPSLPGSFFNAGAITATTIDAAITSLYVDKNRALAGNQAMASGDAVLFSYKATGALLATTYLMVAAGNSANSSADLFIRMGSGLTGVAVGQVTTPFFSTT